MKYTYPSVCNQTINDVDWYVLFSKNIPNKFRIRINELEHFNKIFKPIFLDDNINAFDEFCKK